MWISKSLIAVILGGGAGTRLYPLTASRSKPAVPLAGKYRLVDIPISNCINSNINRIFVLTQFNSASLNKHIKNTYQFSAFSSGFTDILAAEQTPDNPQWFQGTADAVRQSLRHLSSFQYDHVLILSGDQLYQMDFGNMFRTHEMEGADITIATIPVTAKEATEFGILKADEKHRIVSFIEKPAAELLPNWLSDTGDAMKSAGRNYLASMGIYIFKKQVLIDLLYSEHAEAKDFGKEIIPGCIDRYKVSSYQYGGYWTDIGNISSFFEANLALTRELPPFNLFDNDNKVFSRARMLPPAKISTTTISNAIISEGCIINAQLIENSVIGIRTRIGSGTQISKCYVMGSDYYETLEDMKYAMERGVPQLGIGINCVIQNAILDKDCRIGDNVKIRGGDHLPDSDHELYTVKDGIVVVKKAAVLPDNYEIG
ncbi:MAG: glucose-1-phosphate adenylyltransferase [Chitinophagaceae bacterium]|nr:glucose-1-phosphate adenylyltransferase [Chitinophagaceae bacterium]MCW5914104.1 glucose-1-phosphate adenylyltransferase [Chitinophagaceae bacterium]